MFILSKNESLPRDFKMNVILTHVIIKIMLIKRLILYSYFKKIYVLKYHNIKITLFLTLKNLYSLRDTPLDNAILTAVAILKHRFSLKYRFYKQIKGDLDGFK